MAQDCFLTFGICRQMIMMQPGKLSILPLESKQWGISDVIKLGDDNYKVTQQYPLAVSTYLCGQATIFAGTDVVNNRDWIGATVASILNATTTGITLIIDTLSTTTITNKRVCHFG